MAVDELVGCASAAQGQSRRMSHRFDQDSEEQRSRRVLEGAVQATDLGLALPLVVKIADGARI